jgi:phosphoglycerate dehydrogenase-like enzyme
LVSKDEANVMKPTARLLHTSRGPIVDEATLIDAVEGRGIGGAVLDVFDRKPLAAGHPFRSLDNVLAIQSKISPI